VLKATEYYYSDGLLTAEYTSNGIVSKKNSPAIFLKKNTDAWTISFGAILIGW
jgi:hypothetical protein